MKEFTPDPPQLSLSFEAPEPPRDIAAEKRAKNAAYMREWLQKNKERVNAARRARRAENPAILERERAYREAHREKVREWKKPWIEANPDKMREYKQAWAERNREQTNERQKERYHADLEASRARDRAKPSRDPEHLREKRRQWSEQRKEARRLYMQAYLAENSHKFREIAQRRRARKKGAVVTKVQLEQILIRDCGYCGICGRPVPAEELTYDHVIPLARGGPHTAENLQVAHRKCNRWKHAKLPNEL